MIWSLIRDGGRYLTSYLSFFVLALILPPTDFGTVAIAISWYNLFCGLADLGFGAALIQYKQVSDAHLNSVFILNVALGLIFCLIGLILARPLASFFEVHELAMIIPWISINFVIQSFSMTHLAIAQRQLRFKLLARRDLLASLVSGMVGVGLALGGWGVWSLVVQFLLNSLLGSALIWTALSWRPTLEFAIAPVRELWPYSNKIVMFNVFKGVVQNADRVIIGYFLNPVSLGLYQFAHKIVIYPTAVFCGAIGNYAFPELSRIQEHGSTVRLYYLKYLKTITAWILPFVVLVTASAAFVGDLFGDPWSQASVLIQICAAIAVFQSFFSPIGQLMKALNRADWLLYWAVGSAFVSTISLLVGAQFSIVGVAIGFLAAHICLVPIKILLVTHLSHCRKTDLFKAVQPMLVAALSMMAWILVGLMIGHAYVAFVCLGVISYAAVMWFMDRQFITKTMGSVIGFK